MQKREEREGYLLLEVPSEEEIERNIELRDVL